MKDIVDIVAQWDEEAGVWIASSPDLDGLFLEAGSWPELISEIRIVLPAYLEVAALPPVAGFRLMAEEQQSLPAA